MLLWTIKSNFKFNPEELHKSIHHTLFESHLSYGITVWGGVSSVKLRPLSIAQQQCIRILFGDKQAYLEKFKTTARVRPYQSQKLGKEFYEKEPSCKQTRDQTRDHTSNQTRNQKHTEAGHTTTQARTDKRRTLKTLAHSTR